MLSAKQLNKMGEEGFLVAPKENESEFVKRVDFLKKLKRDPHLFIPQKFLSDKKIKEEVVNSLREKMKEKIGIFPDWVVSFYSNAHLRLWQGGACWIDSDPTGIKFPFIQLKNPFAKGSYLGYQEEEVLFHEMLHAIRSSYPESRFEEIFVYLISGKKWRSSLSALFRSPRQVGLFFFILLLSIGIQLAFPFKGIFLFTLSAALPLFPLLILGASLYRDRKLVFQTLAKLKNFFPKKKETLSVAFRLTDKEIRLFAQSPKEEILSYMKRQKSYSLRWRQILSKSLNI